MRKNYRSDLTQSISPYLARQHSLPKGVLVTIIVGGGVIVVKVVQNLYFLSFYNSMTLQDLIEFFKP